MTQKTKKNSAARKLVPAAGMLAVSAMMLATSTYAWFTMAREVEVTNIQMTASVPADLQISLGMLSTVAGSGDGLMNNMGVLVPATAAVGNSADNGGVEAPGDVAEYWSNMADISAYYALGKIMPASSTSGKNLYFTPDATGVGKTIKSGAKYYAAVEGANIAHDNNGNSYMTTLHAYTAKTGATVTDAWSSTQNGGGYVAAKEYNETNDDGYFVDIPVWIRNSSTEEVNLSVDAYVTTSLKNDEDDLYLAARAVILDSSKGKTTGLIEIKKDSYGTAENPGDSIVDFMSTTNSTGAAVASVDENNTATYGAETYYDGKVNQGGNQIVTVAAKAANSTTAYGTPTKVWIRVWLEGEDPNCWNANAGQDFRISLKFSRDDAVLPETLHHFTAAANGSATDSLTAGTATTVTLKDGDTQVQAIPYTFNGTTWVAGDTLTAPPAGKKWVVNNQEIANETQLAAYVATHITSTDEATTGITVSTADVETITNLTYKVDGSSKTFSSTVPTQNVDHLVVNGKTYADADAITADTTLTDGTYDVTVIYAAGKSLYTVSYPTVTINTNKILTFMRVASATVTGDNNTVGDYTYKWYIAAQNNYSPAAGYGVTYGSNTYNSLEALVTAINNAVPVPAAITDLTEVAVTTTKTLNLNVANAPAGSPALKLTQTKLGDEVTGWAADSNTFATSKGGKIVYTDGSTSTEYASVADFVNYLNTNGSVAQAITGTLSYKYNYVGTFTVPKEKVNGHYDFDAAGNTATFPNSFTAYTFAIGTGGTATTYASLAELEAAIDAAIGSNASITVTTSAVVVTP
jgi:hypothetical protein